jgi:hypothetical protein
VVSAVVAAADLMKLQAEHWPYQMVLLDLWVVVVEGQWSEQ